jgi:hypothetical protein
VAAYIILPIVLVGTGAVVVAGLARKAHAAG